MARRIPHGGLPRGDDADAWILRPHGSSSSARESGAVVMLVRDMATSNGDDGPRYGDRRIRPRHASALRGAKVLSGVVSLVKRPALGHESRRRDRR
jgi:hypothetical protein